MLAGRLHRWSLDHPRGRTEILVAPGLLAAASEQLASWLSGRALFLLSTPRVRGLHGDRLEPLRNAAARVIELEVEDGEGAKSLGHAERLWREMLTAGGKRDSRLVTFGGGSVGDLGGFVAGCFLRGIAYAQLPSTLLAQVDAAIGGKTAVDLPDGKNTIGLFHHPVAVLSDTELLGTLERQELAAGLVEVVKMAYLLDPPLLDRVDATLDELLAGSPEALAPIVASAARVKSQIVSEDPEEGDRRRLLNFGHTLGHAIEAAGGYRGLRHGEAVGFGLLFALRLGRRRGLGVEAARPLVDLLRRLELPALPTCSTSELLGFIGRDKKAQEERSAWVLPAALGRGEVVHDIEPGEIRAELAAFLEDPWSLA